MEEITACTHEIIRNEEGKVIVEGNDLYLRNITDGSIVRTPICKEIRTVFGFHVYEELTQATRRNETQQMSASMSKWSRNATLALISLSEKYKNQFQSSTIKNDKIYQQIQKDLATQGFIYTAVQCKDKYKYLKMRYFKRKDNMKRTGEAPIHFEFFEEMDQLLGKKPNAEPVSIASSLRMPRQDTDTDENVVDILEDSVTSVTQQNKKRKVESKTEAVERRHNEKLEVQKAAIKSFEAVMEKLLEKL